MIFQELIDRKFEIRTFFFVDIFFLVAIISSDNSIVDIRNTYSQNRIVPFKLPQKVEDKLFELSKKLRMNTLYQCGGTLTLVKMLILTRLWMT